MSLRKNISENFSVVFQENQSQVDKIRDLVDKLKIRGSLLDKKPDGKQTVLTEKTLVLHLNLHQENLLNDLLSRQVFQEHLHEGPQNC
jgi:uncharacterized protein YjgD (DUF1641 family)